MLKLSKYQKMVSYIICNFKVDRKSVVELEEFLKQYIKDNKVISVCELNGFKFFCINYIYFYNKLFRFFFI